MDRFLFVEVQTYASVNSMGHELGKYAYDRYDQVVVHANCIYDIKNDLLRKAEELQEKYPRCKPLKFDLREYTDRYKEKVYDISFKPDSQYNDNFVFILRTKHVCKMNLEVQLNY
jgi:hypothetical protein